jgi:M6 family metalloprotease-like protein
MEDNSDPSNPYPWAMSQSMISNMKKKPLAFLIALAFIGSSLSTPAFAAVKAGATCKTKGQIKTVSGLKYKCIQSGKKLVWNKGAVVKKPIQTTQGINNALPSQPSSDVSLCKINEISSNRPRFENSLPTGFPRATFPFATKTGTVKWALVPIDFSDIKGESNFRSRVDDQMKLLSEWFETVSEGKFKVEWVVAKNWTTLPGKSSDYKIPFSDGPDRSPEIAEFWRKAISETDKSFDYTNVQTVNFILPLSQTVVTESLQGFPWEQAVKNYVTQEGKISSFSIPGVFFNSLNRQYWSYWAHEFGHAMGLPHIGSSREPNPFLGLDIMGNQDGYTRELTGWMRFVAGWLDDEKVYCQELQKLVSTDLTLVPLSGSKNGIKMAVIPISDSKALIVESRRETKFSCNMPTKKNGVLTYVYDATRSHGENFLIPLTPAGRSNESSSNCPVSPYPDPILRQGEKMKFEGVMIEVLESKDMDRIRISKAN